MTMGVELWVHHNLQINKGEDLHQTTVINKIRRKFEQVFVKSIEMVDLRFRPLTKDAFSQAPQNAQLILMIYLLSRWNEFMMNQTADNEKKTISGNFLVLMFTYIYLYLYFIIYISQYKKMR